MPLQNHRVKTSVLGRAGQMAACRGALMRLWPSPHSSGAEVLQDQPGSQTRGDAFLLARLPRAWATWARRPMHRCGPSATLSSIGPSSPEAVAGARPLDVGGREGCASRAPGDLRTLLSKWRLRLQGDRNVTSGSALATSGSCFLSFTLKASGAPTVFRGILGRCVPVVLRETDLLKKKTF